MSQLISLSASSRGVRSFRTIIHQFLATMPPPHLSTAVVCTPNPECTEESYAFEAVRFSCLPLCAVAKLIGKMCSCDSALAGRVAARI